jgi:L-lactate dehydrogenase (cytochrome)
MAGMARFPRWWADVLTSDPVTFATMTDTAQEIGHIIHSMFDPSVTWKDLDWIRDNWDGPIVIKGIQSVEDAVLARDAGVQGIVLSNHGGRQLDRTPTSLELIGPTRDKVGTDLEVYMDTGVRSGADIVAAVALGADAVMVGRPYLYGLMAGAQAGVARVIEILRSDVERTLALMGVASISELTPSQVTLS